MSLKGLRNTKKVPRQVLVDGMVSIKAGRPPLPNRKRYAFKMDISLHAKLKGYCEKNHSSPSTVICQVVAKFLEEAD